MTGKEIANRLLNALAPFAEDMLGKEGEFFPYGGIVRSDGKIVEVSAQIEDEDQPSSSDLIDVLNDGFKKKAASGSILACAVVFNVSVNNPQTGVKTDAIQLNIDCNDGYSAEVFKPYSVQANSEVVFSSLFAQKGRQEVFVAS